MIYSISMGLLWNKVENEKFMYFSNMEKELIFFLYTYHMIVLSQSFNNYLY